MTSHSNRLSQDQLLSLSNEIAERIEDVFEYFEVDGMRQDRKKYVGPCPIHDGDKSNAFNLYYDGHSVIGNWKCRTHHCERNFVPSAIGLIRGLLSKKKYSWSKKGDPTVSFPEAVNWALKFLGKKSVLIEPVENLDKKKFIQTVRAHVNTIVHEMNITRSLVRAELKIPSEYFIGRGFSKKILDKYDVGDCLTTGKQMYQRAVAPIYDEHHKAVIACTGRSIWDRCPECKAHHNPANTCPSKEYRGMFSKWRHSKGFQGENYLYNYWFAKECIFNSKCVVIVESPGNVWRLEEAGVCNSIAMFGSDLSLHQKQLLDKTGAMNIVVMTDNDEGGDVAYQSIIDQCSNMYNITRYNLENFTDIAEVPVETVKNKVRPFIERYYL